MFDSIVKTLYLDNVIFAYKNDLVYLKIWSLTDALEYCESRKNINVVEDTLIHWSHLRHVEVNLNLIPTGNM